MEVAKVRPGIKVMRIDGRLPGEQGYPLQSVTDLPLEEFHQAISVAAPNDVRGQLPPLYWQGCQCIHPRSR